MIVAVQQLLYFHVSPSDICEMSASVTAPVNINSPNYPDVYTSYINCYVVVTCDVGLTVSIYVDTLCHCSSLHQNNTSGLKSKLKKILAIKWHTSIPLIFVQRIYSANHKKI